MRKLTDNDIEQMANRQFTPDARAVCRDVRANLKLGQLIPPDPGPLPKRAVLDLHQKTVEQAWTEIMQLATSGVRDATIITGASGKLKPLFQSWVRDSVLAPYIISANTINNGSFDVKFRLIKSQ